LCIGVLVDTQFVVASVNVVGVVAVMICVVVGVIDCGGRFVVVLNGVVVVIVLVVGVVVVVCVFLCLRCSLIILFSVSVYVADVCHDVDDVGVYVDIVVHDTDSDAVVVVGVIYVGVAHYWPLDLWC